MDENVIQISIEESIDQRLATLFEEIDNAVVGSEEWKAFVKERDDLLRIRLDEQKIFLEQDKQAALERANEIKADAEASIAKSEKRTRVAKMIIEGIALTANIGFPILMFAWSRNGYMSKDENMAFGWLYNRLTKLF